MLKHWREVKAQHPHTILFYRVGDFYEMFHEDAELASRILDITLTSRGDGVPLAGVPVKAAADYLRQLVGAGHRVAICEQVEDPKLAKGLVRREVVETLTPGALLQEGWLAGGRNNWIVALGPKEGEAGRRTAGLAAIDLSTGEFVLETVDAAGIEESFSRLTPAEVVVPAGTGTAPLPEAPASRLTVERDAWEFDADARARGAVAAVSASPRSTDSASGPSDARRARRRRRAAPLSRRAPAGGPSPSRPPLRPPGRRLPLARRHDPPQPRSWSSRSAPARAAARCSRSIDATVTPMGGRLLRQWLLSPLRDPAAIDARLDAVEVAVKDGRGRARLREALDGVRDIERLAGRAAAGRATPRELGALRDSFHRLPDVAEALSGLDAAVAAALAEAVEELDLLADLGGELAPRARGPAAASPRRRRRHPPRLRPRARRAALAPRRRPAVHRVAAAARARAHRHLVAQGRASTRCSATTWRSPTPTPPGCPPTTSGGRRWPPPSATSRPSSRSTSRGCSAPRSGWRVREAELFGALRAAVGQAIGRIQRTARVLARLDVWTALAERAVAGATSGPRCTTASTWCSARAGIR